MKAHRVGMVGAGQVARAHVVGYTNAPVFYSLGSRFEMSVVAEATEELGNEAAAKYGFEKWTANWKKVTSDPRVDIVDVVTPTYLHKDPSIDALEHGKVVICEKPLATDAKGAREMYEVAKRSGAINMVGFNYRRVPMVILAKQMIVEGKIGKVRQVRSQFLEDWAGPDFPLTWRFRKKTAGAGVLADLGSHAIDLVRYLVSEVKEVCAVSATFVARRKLPGKTCRGPSDVDDTTLALLKLQNGALGEVAVTWVAPGRKVGLGFEVHGSAGSLSFDMERPNELQYYSTEDPVGSQGFRTIYFGPRHQYGSSLIFGAPTMGTGYVDSIVAGMRDLLLAMKAGEMVEPSFYDGWKVSQLMEAVTESSRKHAWVSVG